MIGPYRVNSEARRYAAWGAPCTRLATSGKVTIAGKLLPLRAECVPAFEAWEILRQRHGYQMPGEDTGFYNCRHMRHDPKLPWSTHSWGIALDANWLQNPAGNKFVSDFPRPMIDDLLALQTNSGVYVFTWLGDPDRSPASSHTYYDAMHWEVTAHPLDLKTGINLRGKHVLVDSVPMGGLKSGMRGAAVRAMQRHLNAWKPELALVDDGIYGRSAGEGGATGAAVKLYQNSAQLPVTGEADDTTLIFLLTTPLRSAAAYDRLRKVTG